MVISAMIQEDSKLLWPAGFIKSKKILMYSSGATFQQKKIQQMLAWSCLNAGWESSNSRWFQGSSFWRQEEKHWPNQDESIELATDNPELKKETKSFAAVIQQEDIIGYLEERISNWSKFKRIIVLLLCCKRKQLQHIRSKQGLKSVDSINCNNRLFNLEKLKKVEKEVIKSVQQRLFKEEVISLHNENSLKSSSNMLNLDPFLNQDDILKVGGSTGKCDRSDEIQQKFFKTTELIIRWCHDKVAHAGRGITGFGS